MRKEMKFMNKLFMTTILCLALVLVPFAGVFGASEARVYTKTVLNGNYDDGDSPAATVQNDDSNASFEIVPDPGSDASRGNVGSLSGHVEISRAITNNYKIYVSYDFRATTSGDRLRLGIRDSVSRGVTYIFDMNGGSFGGVTINNNEWYTAHCVIDYARAKKSLSIVDSAGNIKLAPTESSLGFSGTPSHIRFRLEKNDHVYMDNIIVKEEIILADLDNVTGGSDEVNPVYTNNTLKVTMTQNMGSVKPEHLRLIRDLDGSDVPISNVAVSGKVLTLTLGKALQSSSTYTFTVLETAPMSNSSTPVGMDMSLKFTTTARELDIIDVTFTSDASGVTFVANLANVTASDASPVMLISAFDSEGRLTGINQITVDVTAGSDAVSVPLRIPVTSGGYVKVLGIADFNTLAPINNNIYTFRLE